MNLDSLLEIVDNQLIKSKNRPLISSEILILRGIWHYRTYNQIALEAGYSPGYFSNVVAPELYHRLSLVIGQRVTKKNCRVLLESYATAQTAPERKLSQQDLAEFLPNHNQEALPCYPSGSIPLNSPFYLKRYSLEEQVYQEIKKPGALIRIKAPREMGKTSLLLRIVEHGNRLGYHTVSLNLEQVEQAILNNLNQFLRWLCANIAHQLQRKPMLDEYWDDDLGSKISCTLYFQDYLLELINTPLLLALDEVNQIFEHPQVAKDFLPLLRSWYEETKRLAIWQKLRLIVVHSTEIYVPLELNQSPFNVGLPIQLESFSQEEVQQLAQSYGFDWTDGEEVRQLMAMVGGHPALVHLALYHLSRGEITMSQLLATAPSATGIYAHHLQRHWATLEKQPELAQALDTVLHATEPVPLDPTLTHKLSSMGLIKLSGSQAIASCELYRQYFTKKGKQHFIYTLSPLSLNYY
ncbi:MAG: serine/threonine protein kinase [Symploca sp. SIO2E9]|nr:serine/threonine protein kinase [Symploca sp. SIO2E9]